MQENSLSLDSSDAAPLQPSTTVWLQISEGAHVNGPLVSKWAPSAPGPSVASEGAWNVDFSPSEGLFTELPLASKGDFFLPICPPAWERYSLHIPPMINLETVDLRWSPCMHTK